MTRVTTLCAIAGVAAGLASVRAAQHGAPDALVAGGRHAETIEGSFPASRLPIGLLAQTRAAASQTPPSGGHPPARDVFAFGVVFERAVRSGEVHEHEMSLRAGDLVSGTLGWAGVALLIEAIDSTGRVIHARYAFLDQGSPPVPWGFVAPASGMYRVRVAVADDFDHGSQTAQHEPVPMVGTAVGTYRMRFERESVAARMRDPQPPVREDYPSARLERLARDLRAGQPDALESFWREVAGAGPIVELIDGNDREVDVTFLWRQVFETRNVLLRWSFLNDYMSHLAGTDVWYKTLRLRRGTRIQYYMSPNDQPTSRHATGQLDPLNPRRFPDDPTYRLTSGQSVLELPGAPDDQWASRVPTRRGAIEERTVTSALLQHPRFGDERPIWLYTPPGYSREAGPYPLVVLLDGAAYVTSRFGAAPTTFDNLINDERIRPVSGGCRASARPIR